MFMYVLVLYTSDFKYNCDLYHIQKLGVLRMDRKTNIGA